MYLLACFYYVWLEMEEPTLPKVQLLMNEESWILDEETGETELDKRTNTLAVRSPMVNEHPAVSNYRRLKEGAPDTVRSIIIMCNSKFKFMGVAAAKRLFSEDEMNLYELGMGVNGDKTTKEGNKNGYGSHTAAHQGARPANAGISHRLGALR